MKKISIASLNIFGMSLNPFDLKLRYQTISSFFSGSNVDIVFFQEVFSYYHLSILKKALARYPFCIYYKSYIGPLGGLVIFSKYKLVNRNYIKFSSQNMPLLSLPELIFQKGILFAELELLYGIVLINTHFTAVIDQNWSSSGRYFKKTLSEIETFQKVIIKNPQKRIILTAGDFNIQKGSELYYQLINLDKLHDPFKENSLGTRHQIFMPGKKPRCIDYLFIIGNKSDYKIDQKKFIFADKIKLINNKFGYVSDHLGLQVTVQSA